MMELAPMRPASSRRMTSNFCKHGRHELKGMKLNQFVLRSVMILVAGCLQLEPGMAGEPVTHKISGGPGSLAGLWVNDGYRTSSRLNKLREGLIITAEGTAPPLQPWAAQLVEQRVASAEAGSPYSTTKSRCLPGGVPQVMFGPKLPIQFLETPGQVTILIEEFNNFRIIRMNAQHKEDPDPGFMGDSVGRWEGDTLVIDTIGLSDETALDPVGTPHSDALHVIERIRRVDKDTLEVTVEFDDPKTFTRKWTARTAFKAVNDWQIQESFCENNRHRSQSGVVTTELPTTAK